MLLLREITGHEQIIRALLNALLYDRVGHAYLFAGPEGVGKATTALAFARSLLCAGPDKGDACGSCRACRQFEHANHPDLHCVRPEGSSIKIEQIRGIQRKVMFHSYQGGRKVIIIEQAEAMTSEAANCLLKTLEEPPDETVFILLTALPQILPSTVLSRCQQFNFKLIPFNQLNSLLYNRHGLARDEAGLLAALSGGSLGKALAYASGSFQKERDAALRLTVLLKEAGALEALEEAEKVSKNRDNALGLLEMLACWFRDLLVWKETGEARLLFNPDQIIALEKETGYFETGRLVEIIEDITKAKTKVLGNANTRLVLEALFLRLAGGISGTQTDWEVYQWDC
ncbi:MAG: DNA polymerase III subunit tau [Pelotomaculum sp. PtaB.Bin013]|uniref:DNA polymerase III subunit delta' n=1 Tax=Pelotomaculum isophthalicicum JI TaxID=947010 RepID=A0A9X4GXT1_9FIRM|nr:DNA polymerase III subunit delta' [Pelotomaculum isophthalicicum]MDF9407102.1 DNA polymerase III subunit delta' [Pelotomaculum isophthalicicum JI]OPX91165.1 MAG: DNA polymerase III subunit tau [Pelotomaculum sp. PtaB.Bin013]